MTQTTQMTPTRETTPNQDRVISTLVSAFSADPLMRWSYPAAHDYLAHFPGFVRQFGGRAFETATADTLEDAHGAALWLPPGQLWDDDQLIAFMQATMDGARFETIGEIAGRLDGYHPDEPHWYLALLGVDAAYQDRGLGSALVAPRLELIDEQGLSAHLVSSSPRNHSFYRRHGFEIMDEVRVGDAPPLWPMLRAPC